MDSEMTRRSLLGAGAALAMSNAVPTGAFAATVDKPAQLIVNFAPVGVMDVVARLYAEKLRDIYAPSVVVMNRPGAAGRIGIEAAKTSPKDGSVVLMSPETLMVIYPFVYPKTLRYDPERDFIPVTGLSSFGFAWVVSVDHPAQNLQQYIEWAKSQTEVDYSAPAAGSTPHFLAVLLAKSAGFRLNFISYSQGSQAMADLFTNRIKGYMAVAGSAVQNARGGKVRVLAVTTRERMPSLPEAPTFAELGYPQMTADEWYGIFLPAGTPQAVVTGLHASIAQVSAAPEMRKQLTDLEQYPVSTTPEQFAARLRAERDRWGPIVKESGYKVEGE